MNAPRRRKPAKAGAADDERALERLLRILRDRRDPFEPPSDTVLCAVASAVGARAAWLHVVEPDRVLRLTGAWGLGDDALGAMSVASIDGDDAAGRCLSTRSMVTVEVAGPASDRDRAVLEHTAADRLYAIPLTEPDDVTAVLGFASSGPAWPSPHRIHAVASALELAIGRRRLVRLVEALEREQVSNAYMLEAEPDGVVFVDAVTGHLRANRAFEAMLGQPIDPALGLSQKVGIVCWPDGRPLREDELPSAHALEGEVTPGLELLFKRRDGRSIPVTERAGPVRSSDGTIIGAVVSFRDISLQKEVERLREEFAAMVVHDLRTPIQVMLLQIHLLRQLVADGKPVPDAALERLARSGRRLAQMASDLLDATRIDLSRIRLERRPVDVGATTRAIVDSLRPTLGAHQVVVDVASNLPCSPLDAARFEQILTNLVENAARYSASGTTIRVDVRSSGDGVEVAVEDEGIGIAPDELPRLFDRFYHAKRARERSLGLGLGLYIAKGLVEAHGGRIAVESVVDRGSTFRVWLPSEPDATSHASV